jgi:hypothetical protein
MQVLVDASVYSPRSLIRGVARCLASRRANRTIRSTRNRDPPNLVIHAAFHRLVSNTVIMLSATVMRSSALSARCISSSSSTAACSALSSSVASASFSRRGMAGMAGRDIRMRVLLKEDSKLGLKHDIVEVKRGYGRNVLVRQGKAVYATEENKHLSKLEQLRAATVEPLVEPDETNTAPDASSSAAAVAPVASLSVDALRFQMDLVHRLGAQRPPMFWRAVERDQSLMKAVTTKDLYVKLARHFPSLTLGQLTLAGGNSVDKVGEYVAEVALPGIAKPATFKVVVRKLEQRAGIGAPMATRVTAAPRATAPPKPAAPTQAAKSIKA